MFSALDISTSGMMAQRARMNARSSNIANISSTRNADGEVEPYKARYTIFEADESIGKNGAAGVRVAEVRTSDAEPLMRHQPWHPDADESGNVAYPNIQMMTEFTDAMEAARAYEANVGAIEISKNLGQQTLRILA